MIFLVVHVIRVDNRRALLVHPLVPAHVAAGLVGSSRVVICVLAPRAQPRPSPSGVFDREI